MVDDVMIGAQGFGGFERGFEGFKRLHGVATVRRDAKRRVQAMSLSGLFGNFAQSLISWR